MQLQAISQRPLTRPWPWPVFPFITALQTRVGPVQSPFLPPRASPSSRPAPGCQHVTRFCCMARIHRFDGPPAQRRSTMSICPIRSAGTLVCGKAPVLFGREFKHGEIEGHIDWHGGGLGRCRSLLWGLLPCHACRDVLNCPLGRHHRLCCTIWPWAS